MPAVTLDMPVDDVMRLLGRRGKTVSKETPFPVPATAGLFAAGGLLCTLVILLGWRSDIWRADAPANARGRP